MLTTFLIVRSTLLIVFYAFITIYLSGCESEDKRTFDNLNGVWIWRGAYGGLRNVNLPVDSFDFTESLRIENASTMYIVNNDTLRVKTEFRVETPAYYSPWILLKFYGQHEYESPYFDPIFDDFKSFSFLFRVNDDTLTIEKEGVADDFYYWFTKSY